MSTIPDGPEYEKCACGRDAIARRRRPTSVSNWGRPELVCGICVVELDELHEQCARGAGQVDRAVDRFRGRLVA